MLRVIYGVVLLIAAMAWLRYAPAEGGTYIQLGAVRRDDDLLRGGVVVGRLGNFCFREALAPAGEPTQARSDAAGGFLRVLAADVLVKRRRVEMAFKMRGNVCTKCPRHGRHP